MENTKFLKEKSYQTKLGKMCGRCLIIATQINRPPVSAERNGSAGVITQTGGLSWKGAGGCRGGSSELGVDILSLLIKV